MHERLVRSGETCCICIRGLTLPFLHSPAFFRTPPLPRSSGGERNGMPVDNAVVVNCKWDATSGNKGAGTWYMGKG